MILTSARHWEWWAENAMRPGAIRFCGLETCRFAAQQGRLNALHAWGQTGIVWC